MNEEVLISQCLNGDREQDCDYCPAHSSRRGNCCFGLRHEYGDPDCRACVLEDDCRVLAHSSVKSSSSTPRIIYPGRSVAKAVPIPGRTYVSPGTNVKHGRVQVMADYGPQPGEPLLIQQPIQPDPLPISPKVSLFKRFFIVSGWGAGEGFLEMALNFFRKRRPE